MDVAKVKQALLLSQLMKEDQLGKAPDLQPVDGYINPYGRMGTVPPTSYSPYNVV
jgi:hypothetical protein|tara:strand:+ start:162 stop:326 length:165 start_codon:yes stop_codon:yes gene_type:complete